MRKNQLKLLIVGMMTAVFAFGTVSFGAEYVTPDSVLKMELPGDDWEQVKDASVWVKLSDGTDVITMEHLSNGETLPDMTVAEGRYQASCQTVISTVNEVFVITGQVQDEERLDEMRKAVESAKIQVYDTKTAVKKEEGPSPGSTKTAGNAGSTGSTGNAGSTGNTGSSGSTGSARPESVVEESEFSVWVTGQSLNVRSAPSTDAPVLGMVSYADALTVTGIVEENGSESGWYQVDYDGTAGYVSAQYVSVAPPTAEKSGLTLTDEAVTLYKIDGDGATYVYKATDGCWYDGSGRQYSSNGDGTWTCATSGELWTQTAPASSVDENAQSVMVTDEEGNNSQTLYWNESDGTWLNDAGGVYTANDDNTWTGPDGAIWIGADS